MKSVLLTATALLLALLYGIAGAQTCIQADLSHPNQATLTWVDNSTDETGFVLERSLNGGPFTALAPIAANTTQVVDTTVTRSTLPNTYTYRLKAVNGTLSSAFTSPACITFAPLLTAPTAPSGFSVSSIDSSTLSLTWDDVTNEASYEVVGRPANGSKTFVKLATLAADSTNYDWSGLKAHTSYCGRVRAVNAKGNSGYSPIACNTTSR